LAVAPSPLAFKFYVADFFNFAAFCKTENKHPTFPFCFRFFSGINGPGNTFLFRLGIYFNKKSNIGFIMPLNILIYPNSVLRKKSQEVKEITPEIKKLGFDMIDIMIKNKGVGLAAPQVGELKRIITVFTKKGPKIFINPKILKKSKDTKNMEEGCLCFPNLFFDVKRPKSVEFEALDEEGNNVRINDDGFLARILQHEVEHLEGVLFIDKISVWQKLKLKRKKISQKI
jgi:peptide deformylase